MLESFKKKAIAALSSVILLTGFAPLQAMQMPSAPQIERSGDVQNVQYCHPRERNCGGGRGPGYRPGPRPGYYPDRRPGYYPDRRYGYYNGHRGYNYYRPGYRQYNGYWYPLAAFGAGAIIGGAIASQPRYVEPSGGINPRHVAWCEGQYRSYRAYDNTFQPYNGPRQQCYSPYY